ncbi:MAG: threonine synthase, partial [Planctomycetota bacterium]
MRLLCPDCEADFALDHTQHVCPCGQLLEVQHDSVPTTLTPSTFCDSGVWRFADWVDPDLAVDQRVSLIEGRTPLHHSDQIARYIGLQRLRIKHEGRNPTGSFKDRGMTVAISRARAHGHVRVACASTGNTSASMAAYAAAAGMDAVVLVPDGAVALGKMSQAMAHGARTLRVQGDFDQAMSLVRELALEGELGLMNSLNPFRLEGQKTILLEILEAMQGDPPDWFVFPAGNLGNCAAFGKLLRELSAAGSGGPKPRLAAVQAAGASPFADAFTRGFHSLRPQTAKTRATAIRIGAPVSYARAVRAIQETNGTVTSVDDEEIFAAKTIVDTAGLGAEPASCASIAGARKLVQNGTIHKNANVVCLLTGHLLKDTEATLESITDAESKGA